jgi:hypothetical protein
MVLSLTAAKAWAAPREEPIPAPDFAVEFQGEVCPFPLMSAFVLPNDLLDLSVIATSEGQEFLAQAEGGELLRVGATTWQWLAPDRPGFHRVFVQDCTTGRTICIKAFVMQPYAGEEILNGYVIGRYERTALDGDPSYRMPWGLVEVNPEVASTWVSTNFRLGDFLCKQESDYPKYLALKTRLLLKLEMICDVLEADRGYLPKVAVMSAYRTPDYNRRIGNETTYSRHVYGDAADIYVDDDRDELMDDWTGDGVVTTSDAGVLYRRFDELFQEPWYTPFIGGLGLYGPKWDRGPFVHVDTRGTHARWGDRRGSVWLKTQGLLVEDKNGATIHPERTRSEAAVESRYSRLEETRRR